MQDKITQRGAASYTAQTMNKKGRKPSGYKSKTIGVYIRLHWEEDFRKMYESFKTKKLKHDNRIQQTNQQS